jgi:hypothetical protein
MDAISVCRNTRLEVVLDEHRWPLASERRVEIDHHFAELQRNNAAIWNGRILLLHRYDISDGIFRGAAFDTDYASFLAWRDWGFPGPDVKNFFAMAAIRGADGPYLLGVQGGHTVNAGRIYFAGGTPDPADVVDGMVDLEGSLWREVAEETGLRAGDFDTEPEWTTVISGARIAHIKVLRARESASDLRARILGYLAREAEPELQGIAIVRNAADLDPRMPDFVTTFFRHEWR